MSLAYVTIPAIFDFTKKKISNGSIFVTNITITVETHTTCSLFSAVVV